MSGRGVIEVELSGVASSARGWGARAIITEITGRPPVWIPSIRAWSVQETTARDVVAAAERAGYDVVITGPRASVLPRARQEATPNATHVAFGADVGARPTEGLW